MARHAFQIDKCPLAHHEPDLSTIHTKILRHVF